MFSSFPFCLLNVHWKFLCVPYFQKTNNQTTLTRLSKLILSKKSVRLVGTWTSTGNIGTNEQEVKPNANRTGNPGDVICKVGAHEQNGQTTREMYKINCNFINNS